MTTIARKAAEEIASLIAVGIEWGADPEIERQNVTAIIQSAIGASHEWQPMATAPKDGTPILAWCDHKADPYYLEEEERLTTYAAHAEGIGHVEDGPQIVRWGGELDEHEWESGISTYIPAWWFAGDFDEAANPIRWSPLPAPPKGDAT